MIVLLLAGAILAIGAPSFGDMMRNNRLTQAANDFLAAAAAGAHRSDQAPDARSRCAVQRT